MLERVKLAEPEATYTAPPRLALQPEKVESSTMRSVATVYVAPPSCKGRRERRLLTLFAPHLGLLPSSGRYGC